VDAHDPAFSDPTKPIGPVYDEREAQRLARERGWRMARDGDHFRRVVASPRPQRILELPVIALLVGQGVIVICAGGGGIPVVRRADGSFTGVEAVIDKDLASSLLARELKADALLMLTDVDAVYRDWAAPPPGRFATACRGTARPGVGPGLDGTEGRGGLRVRRTDWRHCRYRAARRRRAAARRRGGTFVTRTALA